MTINVNTVTVSKIEDLKEVPTPELIELYNLITEKGIKKFRDRETAESQVFKLIGQLAPGEDARKTFKTSEPKAKAPKMIKEKKIRKRIMRFCFAPGKEFHEPKKNTLRYKVLEMLKRKNGVLFSEIQDTFKWHSKNTYEAIRLIHRTTNLGMWSNEENGDIRIRLVTDSSTYSALLSEAKAA